MSALDIPLQEQVAEVRRELEMRKRVYSHWIKIGKMSASDAVRQTTAMVAVLRTLEALRDQERKGIEPPELIA